MKTINKKFSISFAAARHRGKFAVVNEQEIASAAKAARTDLKRYSAQLAVELAERKLRDRMTPDTQNALVRGFVRHLK